MLRCDSLSLTSRLLLRPYTLPAIGSLPPHDLNVGVNLIIHQMTSPSILPCIASKAMTFWLGDGNESNAVQFGEHPITIRAEERPFASFFR